MNDQLIVVLQQQGFTQNESIIYITLIQYGGSSAGNLARITDINRATVYTVLTEMKKKGRVHTLTKNDVTTFYATDYHTLLGDIERKYQMFQEITPQLDMLANQFTHQKAKLEYHDGEEGVKKAFIFTLQSQTPIYAFLGMQSFGKDITNWLETIYRPQRIKKKIFAYSICHETPANIYYQSLDSQECRETKIISSETFNISGEICIFDTDKVAHIYADNGIYYATIHISQEYYNTMFSLHQHIWQSV